MTPALQQALAGDEYAALPESIKLIYSPREWLWLTDTQKGQLLRSETEPEWDE